MKNIAIYSLIFIFSFSYYYETIEYFLNEIGNTSISWIYNYHCEKNTSEQEKSNEKEEKGEEGSFDDLFLINKTSSNYIVRALYYSKQDNIFSSSDNSQVIFSPPEMI